MYGPDNIFEDVNICAGGQGGKDACQGDTGGPLTLNGVHVGVASWSYGCARPAFPAVYAQTDAFLDWINDEITKNENWGF